MVCILPTTEELDAALARANAAYAARYPSTRIGLPDDFEVWCRCYAYLDSALGPHINAGVIGIPDARLLADGFDFAMQQIGSRARAKREGF